MAIWAVLASPLMIGADLRAMAPEYRAVWLNRGLIAVNQDSLGRMGERLRGNATECQVWRRQLDGGRLNVVLFNNGRGSCAPSAPPAGTWLGPFPAIYKDTECPDLGCHSGGTVALCQQMCNVDAACSAFNIGIGGCCLRACDASHIDHPTGVQAGDSSYRMAAVRICKLLSPFSSLLSLFLSVLVCMSCRRAVCYWRAYAGQVFCGCALAWRLLSCLAPRHQNLDTIG